MILNNPFQGISHVQTGRFSRATPPTFTQRLAAVPGPKSHASVVLLSPVRYSSDTHQEALALENPAGKPCSNGEKIENPCESAESLNPFFFAIDAVDIGEIIRTSL